MPPLLGGSAAQRQRRRRGRNPERTLEPFGTAFLLYREDRRPRRSPSLPGATPAIWPHSSRTRAARARRVPPRALFHPPPAPSVPSIDYVHLLFAMHIGDSWNYPPYPPQLFCQLMILSSDKAPGRAGLAALAEPPIITAPRRPVATPLPASLIHPRRTPPPPSAVPSLRALYRVTLPLCRFDKGIHHLPRERLNVCQIGNNASLARLLLPFRCQCGKIAGSAQPARGDLCRSSF